MRITAKNCPGGLPGHRRGKPVTTGARCGFPGNESGAIAIYVALMLPFLLGLSILVVDAGRLFNLDTSLQNNVDALALAAAAELDRRPDSHVRACRAMQNLVSNRQIFSTGDDTLNVGCTNGGEPTPASDVEWRWLRSIPADHCSLDAPGTGECAFEFSDEAATTFFISVRSRLSAADFTMLLPASLVGGTEAQAVSRSALAGLSRVVCKPTPLMICNPWEAAGSDTIPELRGRIGSITTAREYGGGSAPIGPGQFGLLDPEEVVNSCNSTSGGGQIVQTLTWQLAGAPLPSCQVKNGVCPKTGVVASLDKAVNSRFDIYEGPIGSYLTANPGALVPAARSIWNAKDAAATGCARTTIDETTGEVATGVWYPREQNWDRVAYFAQYSSSNPSLNSASTLVTLPDGSTKALGSLTRHEAYLWETSQPTSSTGALPHVKPAAQSCFASKVANGLGILQQTGLAARVARRDVYASIVNCLELEAAIDAGAPYSLNGASTELPLPALAVAKFFITEPINRTRSREGLPNNGNARQSGTSGNAPSAWPMTSCPLPAGSFSFFFDLGGVPLANRTYLLERPSGTTLEAAIPAGQTPSVAALAAAFNTAAGAITNPAQAYLFCHKAGQNLLFVATPETSNQNQITLGLDVPGGDKRIMMELVDVYSSDNGSDVTRDVVRLHR